MGDEPTSDPSQIVEFHKKLVKKLLESEEVLAALSGEESEIGIQLRQPSISLRLHIDGENTSLDTVDGSDSPPIDPRIVMNWGTALKFWRGELDIMGALFTGAVRVEGQNMDPLFRLKSIVHKAREASIKVAEELGWDQ